MEKTQNFTAATVEEAIETGLKEMGVSREQAQIEVVQEGKVRRIGKSVPAEVKITVVEAEPKAKEAAPEGGDGARAVAFLEGLFAQLGETVVPVLESEDEKIVINLQAESAKGIVGRRGEIIDALQTLAGAVANTGRKNYKRVVVDFEQYRERREETLQHVAEKLAAKAVRLGKRVRLEPMNPYERRIIHSALMENKEVSTHSEGSEPNRFVVITPKNMRSDNRGRQGGKNRGRNDRSGGKFGEKTYPKRTLPKESTPESSGTTIQRDSSYQRFFGSFLGNFRDEEGGDKDDE